MMRSHLLESGFQLDLLCEILVTHVKMPAWLESLTHWVLPVSVCRVCVG